MRIVYVSHAVAGRENYPAAIPRLVLSWDSNYSAAQGLISSPGVGVPAPAAAFLPYVPPHSVIPYGFKPAMVVGADADVVVWCDSTIQLVGDPSALIAKAVEQGVVAFDNPGCPMATWTTDDCLKTIGCPLERARQFNQIMACTLIIAKCNPLGARLLAEWAARSLDGVSFSGGRQPCRGDYRDHRHDQSVLSWMLEREGVAREPYGALTYWADRRPETIFCNRGIGQP